MASRNDPKVVHTASSPGETNHQQSNKRTPSLATHHSLPTQTLANYGKLKQTAN